MAANRKTLIGTGSDCVFLEDCRPRSQNRANKAARWRWLTARAGTLYALCSGDKVLHIGRSATTLSKRFAALGDAANASLHQAIRKILATGKEVRILVLTDHPTMSWGPFAIAGLILGGGAARHLGTAVHELLAQVEWLGEETHYTGGTAEGAKLAREFLASDRAKILKKPGENFTV